MIHKAKKSLGQNFLKSQTVLKKIVEAGEIKPGETILEIGPGKGALTSRLLEAGARVVAVEKDDALYELLREKFEKEIKDCSLVLICGDILEFDPSETFLTFANGLAEPAFGARKTEDLSKSLKMFRYKIIANIPYNITGAILKKFLTEEHQPSQMVLLVQKEVAQRIIAVDKKESLLSISVKAYGEPKMVMKVPARYFSPAPKVDSAVISIKNISKKLFVDNKVTEKRFWEVLHAGFAHKRKKLGGNLKKIQGLEMPTTLKDKRAEELSVMDWLLCIKN